MILYVPREETLSISLHHLIPIIPPLNGKPWRCGRSSPIKCNFRDEWSSKTDWKYLNGNRNGSKISLCTENVTFPTRKPQWIKWERAEIDDSLTKSRIGLHGFIPKRFQMVERPTTSLETIVLNWKLSRLAWVASQWFLDLNILYTHHKKKKPQLSTWLICQNNT